MNSKTDPAMDNNEGAVYVISSLITQNSRLVGLMEGLFYSTLIVFNINVI